MSIFDESTDQTGESQAQADSVLAELVGEGKKYKTVEDLAQGRLAADDHIRTLEEENARLRNGERVQEASETKDKVLELLETLKTQGNQEPKKSTQADQPSPEDLESLIVNTFKKLTTEEQQELNQHKADELVLQKFNGDAQASKAFVAERAKELGMSVAQLRDLSKSSPSAFARLVDVTPTKEFSSSVAAMEGKTAVDTGGSHAVEVNGSTHHTQSYYNEMKQKMGSDKFYNDGRLQRQIMLDRMALGDKYNT